MTDRIKTLQNSLKALKRDQTVSKMMEEASDDDDWFLKHLVYWIYIITK